MSEEKDARWPEPFLQIALKFADRLDNTSDGSGYFHMSDPHANVWFDPTTFHWKISCAGVVSTGTDFTELERQLQEARAAIAKAEGRA